jgi:hypothetical protein
MKWPRLFFFVIFIHFTAWLGAQSSPFSTGKWAKIAVMRQGIVKITGGQLKSLGFSVPMESSQLQLFGFNISQLSEVVPAVPSTGLLENAIKVVDGGDGKIDESDFVLFYNSGNLFWTFDGGTNQVRHQKIQNSDSVFYYLTVGANGRRIANQSISNQSNRIKEKFNQHFLYEKDSVSLLNSGKVFWGIPMGQGVGKQSQISLFYTSQLMTTVDQFKCNVHMASTSYQNNAQFDFFWNQQLVHSCSLTPVSGFLFDDIATEKTDTFVSNTAASWPNKSELKISYSGPSNSTGWIDYVEVHVKKSIGFAQDSAFNFSIEDDYITGENYACKIQNADATTQVWNVTDPQIPQMVNLQLDPNGAAIFYQKVDSNLHFYGLKQGAYETPVLLGPIANQNTLSINGPCDYIIIAAPAYVNAAKKYQAFQLAKFGRNVRVVNAIELYNDFSGGQPSPVAIRNYLKYSLNKAIQNQMNAPAYLLLFGIGNFNTQKLNVNFELPVFESNNSISILSSYTTDDFFTILNTGDDINNSAKNNIISLAVGRIPARNVQDADSVIEKLIYYQTKSVPSAWANNLTWIADDGDYNLHLQDAESIIANLNAKESKWNHKKIYLDLFPALSSTSGNSYPLANAALQQTVQAGTLMINYTGHGNYLRLSEEAILSQEVFNSWNNTNNLPLLVTASCNFAPYDQPTINAIAWDALMKQRQGVIGIVAANRLVFAYSNKQINDQFIQQLFIADSLGKYTSIGKALQKAKLINQGLGGDRVNAYKFNLIGDPALQLIAPNEQLKITSINNKTFIGKDSLLLGLKNNIQGRIERGGVLKTNFNGIAELSIYDAVKWKRTLANQPASIAVPIATQESLLFKGKVSVVNGQFSVDFIVPTQTSNLNSSLRVQIAANNDSTGALIVLDSIFVKQSLTNNYADTIGPKIKAFFNSSNFKNGDWVAPNAIFYIQLNDSSGIQTSGNALGQDFSIWIDQNPIPILMNNYFVADLNSYQSGKAQYKFANLSEGKHSLIVKSWDLLGNGSADTLQFEVPKTNGLFIKNSFVYPNPFRDNAKFTLVTNITEKQVKIGLEVFDQNGKSYYSNMSNFFNTNTQVEMEWNGVTKAGSVLQPGLYFYQFTLEFEGKQARRSGIFMKL